MLHVYRSQNAARLLQIDTLQMHNDPTMWDLQKKNGPSPSMFWSTKRATKKMCNADLSSIKHAMGKFQDSLPPQTNISQNLWQNHWISSLPMMPTNNGRILVDKEWANDGLAKLGRRMIKTLKSHGNLWKITIFNGTSIEKLENHNF